MWVSTIDAFGFATIAIERKFKTAVRRAATAALGLHQPRNAPGRFVMSIHYVTCVLYGAV